MSSDWFALVLVRWLNFAAVAGLFGMALFPLYAPEAARRVYIGRPTTRRLFLAFGALALASTFAWAGATLVNMAGDNSAFWDSSAWSSFLFETSFGAAWIVRLLLALLAVLTISMPRTSSGFVVVAALSSCLLVSQAWIGHVASLAAPARWGVTIAYAFHVLGAGAWFGGLLALAVALTALPRRAAEDSKSAEELLVRFSSVGLAAVFAILLGGVVNALALGTSSPAVLYASGWGRALLIKLALVAAMLAFACFNKFVLMPRLSRGHESALSALARSILIEQVLGFVILAVTAAFGVLDPSS